MDKIAGSALLKQHFSPEQGDLLIAYSKPLYSGWMHLLLSKKNQDGIQLMKEFNQGLQKLRST